MIDGLQLRREGDEGRSELSRGLTEIRLFKDASISNMICVNLEGYLGLFDIGLFPDGRQTDDSEGKK